MIIKRWIKFVCFLVLFLSASLPLLAQQESQQPSAAVPAKIKSVGIVLVSKDNVQVRNQEGKMRPLKIGNPIFEKDTVITGEKGYAQIRLIDGTMIKLVGNTVFGIEEHFIDKAKSDASTKLTVQQGMVAVIAGEISTVAPQKFSTNTPTATIGIRGSSFIAKVTNGLTKTEGSGAFVAPLTSNSNGQTTQGDVVLLNNWDTTVGIDQNNNITNDPPGLKIEMETIEKSQDISSEISVKKEATTSQVVKDDKKEVLKGLTIQETIKEKISDNNSVTQRRSLSKMFSSSGYYYGFEFFEGVEPIIFSSGISGISGENIKISGDIASADPNYSQASSILRLDKTPLLKEDFLIYRAYPMITHYDFANSSLEMIQSSHGEFTTFNFSDVSAWYAYSANNATTSLSGRGMVVIGTKASSFGIENTVLTYETLSPGSFFATYAGMPDEASFGGHPLKMETHVINRNYLFGEIQDGSNIANQLAFFYAELNPDLSLKEKHIFDVYRINGERKYSGNTLSDYEFSADFYGNSNNGMVINGSKTAYEVTYVVDDVEQTRIEKAENFAASAYLKEEEKISSSVAGNYTGYFSGLLTSEGIYLTPIQGDATARVEAKESHFTYQQASFDPKDDVYLNNTTLVASGFNVVGTPGVGFAQLSSSQEMISTQNSFLMHQELPVIDSFGNKPQGVIWGLINSSLQVPYDETTTFNYILPGSSSFFVLGKDLTEEKVSLDSAMVYSGGVLAARTIFNQNDQTEDVVTSVFSDYALMNLAFNEDATKFTSLIFSSQGEMLTVKGEQNATGQLQATSLEQKLLYPRNISLESSTIDHFDIQGVFGSEGKTAMWKIKIDHNDTYDDTPPLALGVGVVGLQTDATTLEVHDLFGSTIAISAPIDYEQSMVWSSPQDLPFELNLVSPKLLSGHHFENSVTGQDAAFDVGLTADLIPYLNMVGGISPSAATSTVFYRSPEGGMGNLKDFESLSYSFDKLPVAFSDESDPVLVYAAQTAFPRLSILVGIQNEQQHLSETYLLCPEPLPYNEIVSEGESILRLDSSTRMWIVKINGEGAFVATVDPSPQGDGTSWTDITSWSQGQILKLFSNSEDPTQLKTIAEWMEDPAIPDFEKGSILSLQIAYNALEAGSESQAHLGQISFNSSHEEYSFSEDWNTLSPLNQEQIDFISKDAFIAHDCLDYMPIIPSDKENGKGMIVATSGLEAMRDLSWGIWEVEDPSGGFNYWGIFASGKKELLSHAADMKKYLDNKGPEEVRYQGVAQGVVLNNGTASAQGIIRGDASLVVNFKQATVLGNVRLAEEIVALSGSLKNGENAILKMQGVATLNADHAHQGSFQGHFYNNQEGNFAESAAGTFSAQQMINETTKKEVIGAFGVKK